MVVEVPPPGAGVTTVTCEVPAAATSTLEMAAWSSVPLTKVVPRAAPFHCTTDDGMKLPPLTASVKGAVPAVALLGEREPTVGAGLLTVSGRTASRPMLFPPSSTNQRLPSGPAAMPKRGLLVAVRGNSSIWPPGVIRPTSFPVVSVNQRLPSGPTVMPRGPPLRVGIGNSVMTPRGVIRPILFPPSSVNQRLPSGPAVMDLGTLLAVGMRNSSTSPVGVIRPILFPPSSVNQRAPSGPAVMPSGPLSMESENSVTSPAVVILPILPALFSVNQRAPSGPDVIVAGPPKLVRTGNSVITPERVIRPMLLPKSSVNQRLPSAPTVMLRGLLAAVGIGNSSIFTVTAPTGEASKAISTKASAAPVLIEAAPFGNKPRRGIVARRVPSGIVHTIKRLCVRDPDISAFRLP